MASVGRRWWKEGDGARPIRGTPTRGQRVENPRWTERWRGVLRYVPQRTVQGPPCVPLALAGLPLGNIDVTGCNGVGRRPAAERKSRYCTRTATILPSGGHAKMWTIFFTPSRAAPRTGRGARRKFKMEKANYEISHATDARSEARALATPALGAFERDTTPAARGGARYNPSQAEGSVDIMKIMMISQFP